MTKQEILQELRKTFRSAEFPSRIDFEIQQNKLNVKMYKTGILDNMQEDNSAFEGWILVLMTFFNKDENEIKVVSLSWESPDENEKSGHYHRFLYRVTKFIQRFLWFKIEDSSNNEEIYKFTQKYLSGNAQLVMNYPKTKAKDVLESANESYLERRFKTNPQIIKGITFDCQDHQLPVGLFNREVANKNSVFTGGKSGIDLWGIKGNNLFIFELKFKNKKVGIISETLLYLWIMEDLFINKKINYPYLSEKKLSKTFRSFKIIYKKANENAGIIKINGVLLADDFHPLVNEDLISFVNKHFKTHSLEIMKQKYSIDSKINLL